MKYCIVLLNLIRLTNCGVEYLVAGGEVADISQFPYSGFLHVFCNRNNAAKWSCGSSIVNQKIILTAAHCVHGCSQGSEISVSVGHRQKYAGSVSSIESILIHKEYNSITLSCDIALLKLKTNLKFNDIVKRLGLEPNPPYSENAVVAGWGWVQENDPILTTEYLHYINQKVWLPKQCIKLGRISIPKGVICATSKNETSYASSASEEILVERLGPGFGNLILAEDEDVEVICGSFGDSGSALVVRGYIQIGIVSYKMPAISMSLVIYTDTGYFYNWITYNAKKLYCRTH